MVDRLLLPWWRKRNLRVVQRARRLLLDLLLFLHSVDSAVRLIIIIRRTRLVQRNRNQWKRLDLDLDRLILCQFSGVLLLRQNQLRRNPYSEEEEVRVVRPHLEGIVVLLFSEEEEDQVLVPILLLVLDRGLRLLPCKYPHQRRPRGSITISVGPAHSVLQYNKLILPHSVARLLLLLRHLIPLRSPSAVVPLGQHL